MTKSLASGGRRPGAGRPPSHPERRAAWEVARATRRGECHQPTLAPTPARSSAPTPAKLLALARDAATLIDRLLAAVEAR